MYDCIIVGAGPAGSAAAYHLAKANRSILLLEKAALPRYKACSGAVSPSVADWFDFDFTPAIDSQITRVRYTWKLGDAIDAELETEPIWSVRREIFDQFLVEQAQAKGAELKDSTAVTAIAFNNAVPQADSQAEAQPEAQTGHWQVTTASETFTARYLIAADGANGPMANWLGFRNHKIREAASLEIATPAPVENGAFSFEFGLVKNGCVWGFPKQQGYSIGLSTFIGNSPKNIEKPLKQYAPEFGASFDQGTLHTHPLKLWDGNCDLHTTNALLAGEAAAIVDPLTAEGIRPAMYSGMHAAKAIDAALNGTTTALADYTQLIHESWGEDMQWAQRIANLFFRVPKIGYRVGIKRPTATKRLGQILAGEISYANIANRVIKRISTSFIPGAGK